MATLTAKNVNQSIIQDAKKIVKDSGFNWEYFMTKAVEKLLMEVIKHGSVEKTLLGGNNEKIR